MTTCHHSAMGSEGKLPQHRYKGIHLPKGRVKGFRVEIRPPASSKIWVGTFDTLVKAMRAFDAAVYLTGKEPYYFEYPENYFPPRTPKPSKEDVQKQAKLLADRTDYLKENTTSFLVDCSRAGSGVEAPPQELKTVSDVKMAPQLAELDEFLQNAEYLELPTELPHSALESNSDWPCHDLPVAEEGKVVAPMEESAAFRRGLSIQMELRELLALCLPAPFDFPPIEDEDFFPNFEEKVDTPLTVSSKRKRDEGAGIVTDGRKYVGFVPKPLLCNSGGASDDDWLRTLILNEPTELNDPLNPRQYR